MLFYHSVPLVTVFLAISGVGFYTTFASLYFAKLHYNKISIGAIQAAYFFGLFVGAYICEQFVRRVGHIQVLAASGSLLAATTLLQALTTNLPTWIATRMLAGISTAAFYVVIECWMLDHAKDHQRGRLLSLYMISLNAGYAFGQLLLYCIDLHSRDAFILASLLYACSVLPIALSTKKLTTPTSHRIRILYLVKTSPFGTTGCLVAGLSMSALYSFLALTPTAPNVQGGNLVICMIIGGLVAQWPIGKCSDFFDRRKVLLMLCCCTLFFYVLELWNRGHSVTLLYTTVFLIGAGVFTLYPLSVTQVIDHLQAHHLASAMGSMLLIYSLGSTLGPLLASVIIQLTHASGLFLYLLMAMGIACMVGVRSTIIKHPIPQEDREDFVSLPRTTALAYELDPRLEETDEKKTKPAS